MSTTRTLHQGQTYDPGYDVPDLQIGQVISGHTVIAAVRETDRPGLLPGLHIVTGYDPTNPSTPYVTWEVAWQAFSAAEMARRVDAGRDRRHGRWVANAGHYSGDRREALADMIARVS